MKARFAGMPLGGMLLLVPWWSVAARQPNLDPEPAGQRIGCRCAESVIRFDVTSVEKIILEPEAILEDPERFWREDNSYRLVELGHNSTTQPPDLAGWRRG